MRWQELLHFIDRNTATNVNIKCLERLDHIIALKEKNRVYDGNQQLVEPKWATVVPIEKWENDIDSVEAHMSVLQFVIAFKKLLTR